MVYLLNPFTRKLDKTETIGSLQSYFLYKPGIIGGQTIYGIDDDVASAKVLKIDTNKTWTKQFAELFSIYNNGVKKLWYSGDGFLYTPKIAGGVNASDHLYLLASNHPAPGYIFLNGTTESNSTVIYGGGYMRTTSLGIGVVPDPVNFGLYIKKPITAGIKFEGGTGYALMNYARAGRTIGYQGLGSLTNNSFQTATYAGNSAPILFTPGGVVALYLDDEIGGHIYSQYSNPLRFFSIGLIQGSETPSAKLHIKDTRDGSVDRTAVIIDTGSNWTANSELQEWKLMGVSKSKVDVHGTYSQIKPISITTTAGVPYQLTVSTLTANRRYKFSARFVGKKSGDAGDIEGEVNAAFYRYTTGGAIQRGTTKSVFFESTNNDDYVDFGVNGDDVVLNIYTQTAMTIQFYITYEVNV